MSPRNLARFVVLAAVWGASFLFIKVALEGLSPAQVALARLASGTAVVGAVLAARRISLPRTRAVWLHLALLALIANVLPFILIAWAEVRISSSLAGVLNATTPFTTAVVALLAGGGRDERASWPTAAGLALGFAGVVVVVRPWDAAAAGAWSGILASLAAAALYGVSFVYSRRFVVGRAPTVGLAGGQLLVATAIMLILAPAIATDPVDLQLDVVASVLALGALGTGAAYLLYYGLIAEVGATTASMVTYAIPIGAVTLGVVVLDEPLTWNLFAGAVLVIVGIAVADGRLSRPARPAPVGELDVDPAADGYGAANPR